MYVLGSKPTHCDLKIYCTGQRSGDNGTPQSETARHGWDNEVQKLQLVIWAINYHLIVNKMMK